MSVAVLLSSPCFSTLLRVPGSLACAWTTVSVAQKLEQPERSSTILVHFSCLQRFFRHQQLAEPHDMEEINSVCMFSEICFKL